MSSDENIFDLSKYGADETGGDQFRPVSGKLGRMEPAGSGRLLPRETPPRIVLKFCNTGALAQCELCGGVFDSSVDLEAFLEGTWDIVCHPCVRKHAPELTPALGLDVTHPRYDATDGGSDVFAVELAARGLENVRTLEARRNTSGGITVYDPESDKQATEAFMNSPEGHAAYADDAPDTDDAGDAVTSRLEGLARRVRALEYLTPDAPNIGPYDELCPYCHRAMIGHFVGHKSRYAVCDSCRVVASTDAHGWHGFLDMANDAPGDPGAWMEQQYRDNHERIQSYQLIELGKFVDPSEYVEPYRDHARKRLTTPPGRMSQQAPDVTDFPGPWDDGNV